MTIVMGPDGDDYLDGYGGDTIVGGLGTDTITIDTSDVTVVWKPGDGDETIYTLGNRFTLKLEGWNGPADARDVPDTGYDGSPWSYSLTHTEHFTTRTVANPGYDPETDPFVTGFDADGDPATIEVRASLGFTYDVSFTYTSTNETIVVYNDYYSRNPNFGIASATGVICFYPGTLVATPAGPRAVETLAIGDLVLTSGGDAMPIRWMGRQTIHTTFADRRRTLPVRIRAGVLGGGLPQRDLLVSPRHALFLAGVLVEAGALIGLPGISQEQAVPAVFTYHHVELWDHALVLAEGVPAETFVDNASRENFDNWAEHEALYGHLPSIEELDLPRAQSFRQLPPALKARLGAAAAA